MGKKITLYEYIANHEPSARQAKKVMEDWGYRPRFSDEPGFASCLKQFVNAERKKGKEEEVLIALGQCHPDRELILAGVDTKHGFDGFASSYPVLPAASTKPITTPAQPPATPNTVDYTPLLVVGFLSSALFLSVAILSKKN